MSFTQNYWSQCDIVNIYIIITKQGTYTIHAFIPTKYQKYTSTITLIHANFLAKVNKLSYVHLHNMAAHDAYNITIHVLTMTIGDIRNKQKD